MKSIILRDCPKKMVQIDLWAFDIGGGFRGFQNVANGLHYIAILFQDEYHGMWCYVENETLVKAFDREKSAFIDVAETDKAIFQEMADKGVMNDKLIIYPDVAAEQWETLSRYISISHFQNNQCSPVAIDSTSDKASLLGAFQLSFLKVIVQRADDLVIENMEIWKEWIRTIYNTELSVINNQVDLFCELMDLLILHLELFPNAYKEGILIAVYEEATGFITTLAQIEHSSLALRVTKYRLLIN